MLLDKEKEFLLDNVTRTGGVLNGYSPMITSTYILGTEADVLGPSVLHLFHDINVALNERLKHGTVKMEHERTKDGGKLRTDVSWAFYPSQGRRRVFAVLELKAPNILTWDDFAGAVTNSVEEEEDVLKRTKGGHKTLLARNAKCCVQQITKYAQNLKIKDVAVFDWQCMFIADFHGLNEDPKRPHLARGIWFKEEQKDHLTGDTFHIILLGFLLRAMARYQHMR